MNRTLFVLAIFTLLTGQYSLSMADTSTTLFSPNQNLQFNLKCQFIQDKAFDPDSGALAGAFGNPAALFAYEIDLVPKGAGNIKIQLVDVNGGAPIVWFGNVAQCSDATKNLPVQSPVCFAETSPTYSGANPGQIVLPDTSLAIGEPIEMHSVTVRGTPTGGLVNVTDRYWCQANLK